MSDDVRGICYTAQQYMQTVADWYLHHGHRIVYTLMLSISPIRLNVKNHRLSISKRLPYKVQPRLSSNSWAGGGSLARLCSFRIWECFESGKILSECDEGILRGRVGVKNLCPPISPSTFANVYILHVATAAYRTSHKVDCSQPSILTESCRVTTTAGDLENVLFQIACKFLFS